jgi:hypothetical protein
MSAWEALWNHSIRNFKAKDDIKNLGPIGIEYLQNGASLLFGSWQARGHSLGTPTAFRPILTLFTL